MIRPWRLGDDVGDDLADIALGRDEPAHLGVGRVGEQQVDALVAEPGEAVEVGDPPVQRGLVHLEVAGVQDGLLPGADRDRQRVGDGVVDREELQPPRPDVGQLALAHLPQVGVVHAVLVELRGDQREGEPRSVDRDVGPLAQQVRQRADVVLVPVRQDDGIDLAEPIGVVRPVRQRDVDAGGVGLAEQHAAVDDQQPAIELEHRHVPSDLLDAAECDDT